MRTVTFRKCGMRRLLAGNPVWLADDKRLAYTHQPPGHLDDVDINEIGTGLIRPLIETAALQQQLHLSCGADIFAARPPRKRADWVCYTL